MLESKLRRRLPQALGRSIRPVPSPTRSRWEPGSSRRAVRPRLAVSIAQVTPAAEQSAANPPAVRARDCRPTSSLARAALRPTRGGCAQRASRPALRLDAQGARRRGSAGGRSGSRRRASRHGGNRVDLQGVWDLLAQRRAYVLSDRSRIDPTAGRRQISAGDAEPRHAEAVGREPCRKGASGGAGGASRQRVRAAAVHDVRLRPYMLVPLLMSMARAPSGDVLGRGRHRARMAAP